MFFHSFHIFVVHCTLQVNVIHTANPMEHVNNAMVQPNFINPVHHASVDLSGHNLVNAHQASGTALRAFETFNHSFFIFFDIRLCPLSLQVVCSTQKASLLKHNYILVRSFHKRKFLFEA